MIYSSSRSLATLFKRCALVALVCSGPTAFSATSSGVMSVSATVLSSCTLGVTPMAFGSYNPAAQSNTTASITVTCSNGIGYSVGINEGVNGGTTTTRLMGGTGSDKLAYSVWQDAAHTVNWDNSGSAIAGTGSGVAQVINAYGVVNSGQRVSPGAYGDTLTFTVTY